jgi:hypothetical protein
MSVKNWSNNGKKFIHFKLYIIKNKKILIAGVSGFIGGHLNNQLLKNNNQIIAADIKPLKYWFQLFDNYKNYLSRWRTNMLSEKESPALNYFYNQNLAFLLRLKFDFFKRIKRLIETLCWFLVALIKNACRNFFVKETY